MILINGCLCRVRPIQWCHTAFLHEVLQRPTLNSSQEVSRPSQTEKTPPTIPMHLGANALRTACFIRRGLWTHPRTGFPSRSPKGFEPTPLRSGALSHRLRPLGQTVLPKHQAAMHTESDQQSWRATRATGARARSRGPRPALCSGGPAAPDKCPDGPLLPASWQWGGI